MVDENAVQIAAECHDYWTHGRSNTIGALNAIRNTREIITAYLAATSPAGDLVEPAYTTGHCKENAKPGGCQLHNLQCGWPECDRKPAAQALRHQSTGVTGEWRTMESVPKDGTRFLAYGAYDYPGDAAPTEYFEVAAYSGDDEWPWETGEGLHKAEFFSHWQPITHPPAALSAQERE